MLRTVLAAALAAGTVGTASDVYAQAGLLSGRKDLAPITLASGKPLAAAPYQLEAGKYYRIAIEADGSAEPLLLLESEAIGMDDDIDVGGGPASVFDDPQAARLSARAGTAARSVILRVMVTTRSSGRFDGHTMEFGAEPQSAW